MDLTEPDPVVWNDIAECCLLLGDTDGCIQALRRSIELAPGATEAYHNMSLVFTDLGDYQEAEQLARKAVEIDCSLGVAWWSLGRILYLQERYEPALKALATATGLIPDDAQSHLYLALTLTRLGRPEKAERAFYRAVQLTPDDAEVLREYGAHLLSLDRPEDAEMYLRRAIDTDPYDYKAHTGLAEALIERVKTEDPEVDERDTIRDAMENLNKSLSLEVRYGKTWFHWGELFLMFREWGECARAFRASIEEGYADPMAYALLAAALSHLGRDAEAEEAFSKYKRIIENLE